jgi:hypothetical protein
MKTIKLTDTEITAAIRPLEDHASFLKRVIDSKEHTDCNERDYDALQKEYADCIRVIEKLS